MIRESQYREDTSIKKNMEHKKALSFAKLSVSRYRLIFSRENTTKKTQEFGLEGLSVLCSLAKLRSALTNMLKQVCLEICAVFTFLDEEVLEIE